MWNFREVKQAPCQEYAPCASCNISKTTKRSVLPSKLPVSQLAKKFYRTRRPVTTFTNSLNFSLSWIRRIHFTPSHNVSWRYVLILSFHLSLDLPSSLLLPGYTTKAHTHFSFPSYVLHVPPIPSSLVWCLVRSTDREIPHFIKRSAALTSQSQFRRYEEKWNKSLKPSVKTRCHHTVDEVRLHFSPNTLYVLWGPLCLLFKVPPLKWPGREANHSCPTRIDAKNEWSYKSTPPIRLSGIDRKKTPSTFSGAHRVSYSQCRR